MIREKRQKGIVFFTTLILLSVVVLICSGMTIMLLRNTFTVNTIKYGAQAQFLADAGVAVALKDMNDYSFNPPDYPKVDQPLGKGTYTVSYTPDGSRILITSKGTVRGVSRYTRVQVYNNTPEAFNYAVLSEDFMVIGYNSAVTGNVHSNSPNTAHSNPLTPAVRVGFPFLGSGTITGSATACGDVVIWNGTISVLPPPAGNGKPQVKPPPLGADFFQYYYDLANADTKVLSGPQTFTSNPCATGNHVVYVNGNVTLSGTWTMPAGCIVATGSIEVNRTHPTNTITLHRYQDSLGRNYPVLMSRDSYVLICAPTIIEGMVYAGTYVTIYNYVNGQTQINGAVYAARGTAWLTARTVITYVKPNPPGPTET